MKKNGIPLLLFSLGIEMNIIVFPHTNPFSLFIPFPVGLSSFKTRIKTLTDTINENNQRTSIIESWKLHFPFKKWVGSWSGKNDMTNDSNNNRKPYLLYDLLYDNCLLNCLLNCVILLGGTIGSYTHSMALSLPNCRGFALVNHGSSSSIPDFSTKTTTSHCPGQHHTLPQRLCSHGFERRTCSCTTSYSRYRRDSRLDWKPWLHCSNFDHVLPHVLHVCQSGLYSSVPPQDPQLEASLQVLSLVLLVVGGHSMPLRHVHLCLALGSNGHVHRRLYLQVYRISWGRKGMGRRVQRASSLCSQIFPPQTWGWASPYKELETTDPCLCLTQWSNFRCN